MSEKTPKITRISRRVHAFTARYLQKGRFFGGRNSRNSRNSRKFPKFPPGDFRGSPEFPPENRQFLTLVQTITAVKLTKNLEFFPQNSGEIPREFFHFVRKPFFRFSKFSEISKISNKNRPILPTIFPRF